MLATGNTARVAAMIRKFTKGDEFCIEMVHPYSAKYNECIEEAQKDQRTDARPELTSFPDSIERYETIYLGYPNY